MSGGVMDRDRRSSERGQLLVVFALALIAIIGAVGLIIDGGSAFVQRRDQQTVADLAAMAAGYAQLAGQDEAGAARAVTAANGFTHGEEDVEITVTVGAAGITVVVSKPHQNYFAGALGFASWDVSAEATVQAGIPNGTFGAMPLIFNEDAFDRASNRDSNHPAWFGEPAVGTEDVPLGDHTFNWTVYCTANGNPCNGNSSTVETMILGGGASTTIYLNDQIGPLNAGSHTTLFDTLAGAVGRAYPVGIVNDGGGLIGWAWFHITGSVGGSTKQIGGWFDPRINPAPMRISPTGGSPGGVFGAYVVQLID